jgi:hypothetical protein
MKLSEQLLAALDIPHAELRAQPLLFAPDASGDESPDAKRPPIGQIQALPARSVKLRGSEPRLPRRVTGKSILA